MTNLLVMLLSVATDATEFAATKNFSSSVWLIPLPHQA
jgi:hypothetical protein